MVGKGLNRESSLYSCLVISDYRFYITFGYRFHSKNLRSLSRSVSEYLGKKFASEFSTCLGCSVEILCKRHPLFFVSLSQKRLKRCKRLLNILHLLFENFNIAGSLSLSKRLGAWLSGLYPSVSPSLLCHRASKVHLLHSVGGSANYSLESDNDDEQYWRCLLTAQLRISHVGAALRTDHHV